MNYYIKKVSTMKKHKKVYAAKINEMGDKRKAIKFNNWKINMMRDVWFDSDVIGFEISDIEEIEVGTNLYGHYINRKENYYDS